MSPIHFSRPGAGTHRQSAQRGHEAKQKLPR
jgi:hypothetical protein